MNVSVYRYTAKVCFKYFIWQRFPVDVQIYKAISPLCPWPSQAGQPGSERLPPASQRLPLPQVLNKVGKVRKHLVLA